MNDRAAVVRGWAEEDHRSVVDLGGAGTGRVLSHFLRLPSQIASGGQRLLSGVRTALGIGGRLVGSVRVASGGADLGLRWRLDSLPLTLAFETVGLVAGTGDPVLGVGERGLGGGQVGLRGDGPIQGRSAMPCAVSSFGQYVCNACAAMSCEV